MMTLALIAAVALLADAPDLEQAFRQRGAPGVAAAAKALVEEKGAADAVRVLSDSLKHKDVGLRAAAAHVLGTMGADGKRALPALIESLDNDNFGRVKDALGDLGLGDIPLWLAEATLDPDTSAKAGLVLSCLGVEDPRLVPILIRGLGHRRSDVRWEAATLLGYMGPVALPARAALVRLLQEEPKTDTAAVDFFSSNEVRAQAAFALGAIQAQPDETVRLLVPMLRHKDPEIRIQAALGLGRLGDKAKAAIPALIGSLSDEAMTGKPGGCIHSAHPYHAAGTALANIGAASIPALIQVLDAKEPRVRWHAADTLWCFGEEARSAVPALLRRFQDPDAQVRCKAAVAARWIAPDAKLLSAELARLAQDSDPAVRIEAASSLGSLKPRKAVGLEPLLRLADDADPRVRCTALNSLDLLAANVAVDAALRRLRKDPDSSVRQEAVRVLSRHCSEMRLALPTLVELCKDNDPAVRRVAAAAVANTQSAKIAITILVRLANDNDASVQATAAESLGSVGPAAVPAVYDLLKRPAGTVRAAAAKSLGRIGPKPEEAIPKLLPLLKDKDASVQAAAAEAVGRMGAAAVPALLEMLQREAGSARAAIATALGNIGPETKAVVPALMSLLKDPDGPVRCAAASALGGIGEDASAAVPSLVNLLHDAAPSVRRAAADALGDIGPTAKVAAAALTKAQQDPEEEVRDAAAEALGKIQAK